MDKITVYFECAIEVLKCGQEKIGHVAAFRAANVIYDLVEKEHAAQLRVKSDEKTAGENSSSDVA